MNSNTIFAYGSNMLKERLIARCPNSIFAGRATLANYRLTFGKAGLDGSGKCTFTPDPWSNVEGILWSIDPAEQQWLDRLEGAGRGYERRSITLSGANGEPIEAQTYYAPNQTHGSQPYDWYLALVIAGARQHGLPTDYISVLLNTRFQIDSQTERRTRLQAIEVLQSAGMLGVLNELKEQ